MKEGRRGGPRRTLVKGGERTINTPISDRVHASRGGRGHNDFLYLRGDNFPIGLRGWDGMGKRVGWLVGWWVAWLADGWLLSGCGLRLHAWVAWNDIGVIDSWLICCLAC